MPPRLVPAAALLLLLAALLPSVLSEKGRAPDPGGGHGHGRGKSIGEARRPAAQALPAHRRRPVEKENKQRNGKSKTMMRGNRERESTDSYPLSYNTYGSHGRFGKIRTVNYVQT